MGLKLKSLGSTRINRQALQRGVEPGNAYYIQNQPQVAGDPSPDLVVEVDITTVILIKISSMTLWECQSCGGSMVKNGVFPFGE